jgi:hypothetical protein
LAESWGQNDDRGWADVAANHAALCADYFGRRVGQRGVAVFLDDLAVLAIARKAEADGWVGATGSRGLGINERTALLVEADGSAHAVGDPYNPDVDPSQQLRSVYFLQANGEGATVVEPKTPLSGSS